MPAGLGSVIKDLTERGVKVGGKVLAEDAVKSGSKIVSEEAAKKLTEASGKSALKASTEGVVEEGVKQGGKKGFFGTMMMNRLVSSLVSTNSVIRARASLSV